MIFRLPDDDIYFPDPKLIPDDQREANGFYAIGGLLTPDWLLEAYAQGIFPWTSFRDLEVKPGKKKNIWNEIRWYCPMQRFVIFPEEIHISHSMRTLLNKGVFTVTINKDFEGVIAHCSELRINEQGAWLGPQMIEAYTHLHELGYAHSVEVWQDNNLVGGLYGVVLNKVFFGESMFSLVPSGSKVALINLCKYLNQIGWKFIDCQLETPHLKSMGARYISYDEYMDLLWK